MSEFAATMADDSPVPQTLARVVKSVLDRLVAEHYEG